MFYLYVIKKVYTKVSWSLSKWILGKAILNQICQLSNLIHLYGKICFNIMDYKTF